MKSGRLLLADRHLGVLGSGHGLLHDLFDSVVMVADERSLAEAVTDLRPDLVVMDLSLPRGQGVDLAGRLLACHPGLRLVVLSVHDEALVADRLMASGVAGFVVKRAVARTCSRPSGRHSRAARTSRRQCVPVATNRRAAGPAIHPM